MASCYFDSSALVKYYHPPEAGSAEVIRLVQEPNARHFISRLTTVEVVSAFAIKARTREIDEDDFELLRQRFLRDVAQRQFQDLRLANAHYQEAVGLFRTHFMKRFRAYDAIHLSVALDLNRRGLLDYFVCADESLCSVATEEGLSTINPVQP
jgi:predicted nucleic acid-binding protein